MRIAVALCWQLYQLTNSFILRKNSRLFYFLFPFGIKMIAHLAFTYYGGENGDGGGLGVIFGFGSMMLEG